MIDKDALDFINKLTTPKKDYKYVNRNGRRCKVFLGDRGNSFVPSWVERAYLIQKLKERNKHN
jgi:hypothetical protein